MEKKMLSPVSRIGHKARSALIDGFPSNVRGRGSREAVL